MSKNNLEKLKLPMQTMEEMKAYIVKAIGDLNGREIVIEHGTATIRDEFRFKAAIESWHTLLHGDGKRPNDPN